MVRVLALLCLLCPGAAAARALPDFLVEVEVSPGTIYAGSEAILRLRLLREPSAPYGVLRPPALENVAEVWPLERARWYETVREGVIWHVHERMYLLVPHRAGNLEVPGAELEGPLRHALTSSGKGGPLRGPVVRIDVRPAPPDAGEPWLPARELTLEESWSGDPANLAVGTPLTRTITIRAEGQPAKRLPAPQPLAHEALRVHHDQPELFTEHRETGTIGRKVQRVVLVPLDEAEVVLPAFSVRWWDVVADVPRVATLPARTLRLHATAPETAQPVGPVEDADFLLRAAAVALVSLLIGWLWWRARTQARREARAKLRKACRENNARAARDALLEWRSAIEPGVATQLLSRIGEAWSAEAKDELRALDAALYGARAWDGRQFWRRVRPCLRRKPGRGGALAMPATFFRLQAGDASPRTFSVRRSPR